jgi:hypothetical protein
MWLASASVVPRVQPPRAAWARPQAADRGGADVSPSSIYRYSGTKEQVVLWDEVDVRLFDTVEAELQTHPPVEAMRRAITEVIPPILRPDR